MDRLNFWVYVDYTNNIWKIFVNSNNELQYTIMYKEGKWTKEKIIDKGIIGFYVYTDENGIHIIYSNTKAELKYCTFIDQQWMGKTLYKIDNEEVEIHNLKINIIDKVIHIFYLLIDKDSNDHGILMHCTWNGKETKVIKLQDLILVHGLSEYYLIYLDENSNIELLFLSDEGNEISLNYCSYENKKWTPAIRLYGVSGDDFEFKMIKDKYGMHVLNKCREDSVYYLEHVSIKKSGDFYKSSVYESINELVEPLLFKIRNKIYSCWLEENKIYSSVFNGKVWSSPTCLKEYNGNEIKKYNYCISFDKENYNDEGEVYGIGKLDFSLIIPSLLVAKSKEQLKLNQTSENQDKINQENMGQEELHRKYSNIKRLESELSRVKSENSVLEQTVASLNMRLQKNQTMQGEYEEQISKILHYKQKADENYTIFMELQQKMQNELADINKKLEEEKNTRGKVEKKFKKSQEENAIIKEQVDMLIEENNKLIEENNKLIKELESERNQSTTKSRFWKL